MSERWAAAATAANTSIRSKTRKAEIRQNMLFLLRSGTNIVDEYRMQLRTGSKLWPLTNADKRRSLDLYHSPAKPQPKPTTETGKHGGKQVSANEANPANLRESL